jgi:hypothetical protein
MTGELKCPRRREPVRVPSYLAAYTGNSTGIVVIAQEVDDEGTGTG